jgi:hypothetical protein
MIEHTPQNPDVLFSHRALMAARSAGAAALQSDAGQLRGLLDFANANRWAGQDEFPGPGEITFVGLYGSGDPGKTEKRADQLPADFDLYGPDQLTVANTTPTTTLGGLEGTDRDIIGFSLQTPYTGSLTRFISSRLMGPPPGEAKMAAGVTAWARQIGNMFGPSVHKLSEEALQRFPNAVVLESQAKKPRRRG